MKKAFLFAFVLLLFITCKKSAVNQVAEEKVPSADFNTSKTEYIGGETIELTNASADAETIRWTLPDGTTSKANTVTFNTPQAGSAQAFNFKLEALSKSGTKSDYVVKKILTKPTTGKLILYSNYTEGVKGNLKVANEDKGEVTIKGSVSAPNCGAEGYLNYELPIGTSIIEFTSQGLFGPVTKIHTVTVSYNQCTQLRLP